MLKRTGTALASASHPGTPLRPKEGETQAIFSSERLVCSVLHCLFLLVYQSGNVQAVTTLDHAFPARRPAISVEGRNARVAACVHEVARTPPWVGQPPVPS